MNKHISSKYIIIVKKKEKLQRKYFQQAKIIKRTNKVVKYRALFNSPFVKGQINFLLFDSKGRDKIFFLGGKGLD